MKNFTVLSLFLATCLSGAFGCKHSAEIGATEARAIVDTRHIVTVCAEAKYYLTQIPPHLVSGQIYGDEMAAEIDWATNIDGVVMEIIEPPEYAGKIYTFQDRFPGHQANHTFSLGSLYEFRAARAEIGKFSFNERPYGMRELSLAERKDKLERKTGPRTDDLEWLVGRWRCITREWLTPYDIGPLGSAGEDALDYFNVYFPFTDERLTLKLTDNPEDRPIAAEFLARHIRSIFPDDPFEERLITMQEAGPVRISKDKILVGPLFETVAFQYSRREGRNGPLLILQSKFMRLEFYKLEAALGDIKQSFVQAPIKEYSPDQIADLKRRYEEMVRLSQKK